jgi:adenylate kinase family enzyme
MPEVRQGVQHLHVAVDAGALTATTLDGAELVQRPDDREDVIENRLRVYENHTRPLIDHYRQRGLLKVVAADGPIERVYRDSCRRRAVDTVAGVAGWRNAAKILATTRD